LFHRHAVVFVMHRLPFVVAVVFVFGACNLPNAATFASKKLIEFGWDKPFPRELTTAQLESSIFAGVMFRPSAGQTIYTPTKLEKSLFDQDIAALNTIKSSKLENSFYILNVNTKPWDWFDDMAWAAAEENLYNMARVAKQGGLRGIMYDPEVYQFDLWAYASQPQKTKHSFAAFQTQLRQRGAQTMRAFERAYPGITILSLYGFAAFEIPENATYQSAQASLETDGGLGLFAAYLEGMLQAASERVVLIDGYEQSYYHLSRQDFEAGRKQALEDAQIWVAPSLHTKFQKQVRFANALYVDGLMNFHHSARFFGYYLRDQNERLNVVGHNLYHGLQTSDEFVWVYSEKLNWWKHTAPQGVSLPALEQVMQDATRAVPSNATAMIAQAKTAFDKRISVGGDIVGRAGLNIVFTGLENHCATWNNAQRWSCTQPGGSSFVVVPKADGVQFEPPSLSFQNQTKDTWALEFNVK
jgi:hypothetical protein